MNFKYALIIGASGGIGSIISGHLVNKGWKVSTSSRNSGDFQGDVSDANFINGLFLWHNEKYGIFPELVVNAAAIQGPLGPLWECEDKLIEKNLKVNLQGSVNVVKYALKYMEKGSVILFSGGGATNPRPGLTCYSICKTAVLRLVENAASELKWKGREGIIVNAIAPGAVGTEMMVELKKNISHLPQNEIESATLTIENGGTPPEKISTLIDFLANPAEHKGLTGKLIHVRENYREFVSRYSDGNYPPQVGTLIRKGL